MPTFVYTARDSNGHPQQGVVSATSSTQLAEDLRGRG
jgi:type II secretory pathway component PulF